MRQRKIIAVAVAVAASAFAIWLSTRFVQFYRDQQREVASLRSAGDALIERSPDGEGFVFKTQPLDLLVSKEFAAKYTYSPTLTDGSTIRHDLKGTLLVLWAKQPSPLGGRLCLTNGLAPFPLEEHQIDWETQSIVGLTPKPEPEDP